jgi:hypothetical protein
LLPDCYVATNVTSLTGLPAGRGAG